MSRFLVLLRVLIVLGAFAGIAQTQGHISIVQLDPSWPVWSLDQRTLVKFAFTAISLSLL
jgi:hypothetical protein